MLSIYKNSFFPRTIREWNLLPTSVTDATTIEEFKVGLGHALPADSNPVAMPILTVHTVILTFGKMRLSLSPLTGQRYLLLKNPDQYLKEEEDTLKILTLIFLSSALLFRIPYATFIIVSIEKTIAFIMPRHL